MIVAAIAYASTTTRLGSWTALEARLDRAWRLNQLLLTFLHKGLRYPRRHDRWRGNTS
jgi:hypothetical protein